MRSPRPRYSLWIVAFACAAAAALFAPNSAQAAEARSASPPQFAAMLHEVEEIMGLRAKRPISPEIITRSEISQLVERRLGEGSSPEEIGQEELFLHLFGFVDDSFDLAEQVVEVLTEQATALYDYKTKKLYLATWTSADMREYALVHELAHAIADQHFNLDRYMRNGKTADSDLARSAVIEGQASWVMTEWVMRKGGRSLAQNTVAAIAAASSSRHEVDKYPVYSSAPLYLRETMLFPYAEGLLFQQAAVERYGRAAFTRVFKKPPETTQQILEPETYFDEARLLKPDLPPVKLPGFERTSRGDIGQLDHRILVQQYLGSAAAEHGAEGWRGSRFEIWQDKPREAAVLRYASQWASAEHARNFFERYTHIVERKWKRFEVHRSGPSVMEGVGDNGRYTIRLQGAVVTSVEGVPESVYRGASAASAIESKRNEPPLSAALPDGS